MRFALGTPGILKKEVFMSNRKFRLAQELVKLATLVVVFLQQLLKLLSMAFNYPPYSHQHDSATEMDLQVHGKGRFMGICPD